MGFMVKSPTNVLRATGVTQQVKLPFMMKMVKMFAIFYLSWRDKILLLSIVLIPR